MVGGVEAGGGGAASVIRVGRRVVWRAARCDDGGKKVGEMKAGMAALRGAMLVGAMRYCGMEMTQLIHTRYDAR